MNKIRILKRFNHEAAPVRKRFYKAVSLKTIEEDSKPFQRSYEVMLDGRNLRTAHGTVLTLPTKTLAVGVAAEWEQQNPNIEKATMPLTSILNLCIDNTEKTPTKIIDHLLQFLATDTLLFRSCGEMDSSKLEATQNEKWSGPKQKLEDIMNVKLGVSNSFMPPKIDDTTYNTIRRYLETYDMWSLIAMERVALTLKSAILPILLSMREIQPNEAVDLSFVEQDFQTDRWGRVEWQHDIERQDLYAKTCAAALVMHHATETQESFELTPLQRLQAVAKEMT